MPRVEGPSFDADRVQNRIQLGGRVKRNLVVGKKTNGFRGRREPVGDDGWIRFGRKSLQAPQPSRCERVPANRLDYAIELQGPLGASVHRG